MEEHIDMETAVQRYLELRDLKEKIDKAAKARTVELDRKMEVLERWFAMKSEQEGVESWRTDFGTAYFGEVDFCSVGDWDEVLEYAVNNDALDILHKGVNKTAIRGFIEEHDELPPGVNYGKRRRLYVRKPTAKE